VGMRMMGLRVVDPSGRPVGMLAAGVHALNFYVAVSTILLWACDVLVGFFLDVPAKGVSIDITIETRDRMHTLEVFEALAADGLAPQRIDSRRLSEAAN